MDPAAAAAVERYVSSATASAATNVVGMVSSGGLNILQLVESLGPALTGTSADPRRHNATELLGLVVNGADAISDAENTVVAKFLIQRVKDAVSVTPAAAALRTMAMRQPSFGALAIETVEVLFGDVTLQGLAHEARQAVLGLMVELVTRFCTELEPHFGDKFAAGVVRQVDQEKDPRCLILAFSLVESVARIFPIEPHSDDLFEVVSCYFPIAFTPPPNDKVGIAQTDLVGALRRCFVASPLFATPFLKLVFETIATPGDESKVQCYETLGWCAPWYPVAELAPFVGHMYSAARQEQFASFDEEIKTAALGALSGFAKALARSSDGHQPRAVRFADGLGPPTTGLEKLLEPIVTEGVRHLSDFDMGFVKVQTRLMAACVRVSAAATTYVCQRYFPAALAKRADPACADENRVAYVKSISDILTAASELRPSDVTKALGDDNPADIMAAAMDAAGQEEPAAAAVGLQCLGALISLQTLSDADVGKAVTVAVQAAVVSEDKPTLQPAGRDAIKAVVRHYPAVGLKMVIPELAAGLDGEAAAADGANTTQRIDALVAAAVDQQTRCVVVPVLLACLASGTVGADEFVGAIQAVCEAGATDKDEELCRAVLIPTLKMYFGETAPSAVAVNPAVVTGLAAGISACARVTPAAEQLELLEIAKHVFVMNDLGEIELPNRAQAYIPRARGGGILQDGELMALFRSIVANLRPELVTHDLWRSLHEPLTEAALVYGSDEAATAAAVSLASLLNKLEPDEAVGEVLLTTLVRLDGAPGGESRAAMARSWLTKAASVRGHSAGQALLDRLIAELKDEASAPRAAQAFQVVVSESEVALSQASFAKLTFMYKQRLYTKTSAALIDGYRAGAGVVRASHLEALIHTIVAVPRQVLLNEVGTVWQLILEALQGGNAEDEAVIAAVLGLLQTLLVEAKDRVSENANTVVGALLPLCFAARMRTRMAALDCLSKAAELPAQRIFPLAEKVTRTLARVLDDKKRLVRRKAVGCRAKWLTIGGTA